MVRIAFFVLVLANVLFLAWASWVAGPGDAGATSATANLPQLELVSEVRAREREREQTSSPPAASRTALQTSTGRCVSVGPFNDLTRAARAAALLRERGFNPQQRAEEGERWAGYWVYVGGLNSAAEERQVLRNLERAGITDAHAMPESTDGRRVSVGLFSDRQRADRRARAVERLGFKPQITERRQSGTVYWVDLDLGTNDSPVPTEGLVSLEEPGSRIEVRVCPSAAQPVLPEPATADARASLPG